MLSFLPKPVVGTVALILVIINTIAGCIPLCLLSLLKVIPIKSLQIFISRLLVFIAENWVAINNAILLLTQKIEWDIEGLEGLNREGWYLVSCNHQSWIDIVILQKLFTRHIPFLKFFLKQKLIWVPFLGPAWWALDFPFMKRFSKDYIAKHPEMKGKDLETTKKACEKFKTLPVSVMNFIEGTRFSESKRIRQQSPYQNLLKPKAGGVAFVLSAMGGHLNSMVDVTIVYQNRNLGLWDLMCGRISKVIIKIQERAIPEEMARGNYDDDSVFREGFQSWISELWHEKDALISKIKDENNMGVKN